MVFDPNAGQVTDLGIAFSYQGIISGIYDPLFNRYYCITDPRGEFTYYDIAEHTQKNLGRANNWDSLCGLWLLTTVVMFTAASVGARFSSTTLERILSPRAFSPAAYSAERHLARPGLHQGRNCVAGGHLGRANQEGIWRRGERHNSLLV